MIKDKIKQLKQQKIMNMKKNSINNTNQGKKDINQKGKNNSNIINANNTMNNNPNQTMNSNQTILKTNTKSNRMGQSLEYSPDLNDLQQSPNHSMNNQYFNEQYPAIDLYDFVQ